MRSQVTVSMEIRRMQAGEPAYYDAHLPVLRVIGSDRDVADGGVEPYIKHLVLVAGAWHRRAPLEVARDAAQLQAVPHPCICHL